MGRMRDRNRMNAVMASVREREQPVVPLDPAFEQWLMANHPETRGPLHHWRIVEEAWHARDAEVAALRTVLNDLLLTRQAREEEWKRYVDDEGGTDGAQDWEAAYDRLMEVDQAHEAAWDRARSLLAGEEKP